MWDLRTPSGLLFALLGLILCAVGLISPETRAPLTEANVNLASGVVFLVFGLVLLWMAKRAA
jgi:putative Ca2+/H+ antiporter (TMEM165/GDT1 family)